jgi:hypothetical protein
MSTLARTEKAAVILTFLKLGAMAVLWLAA